MKLLLLHSTGDNLGSNTAQLLKERLSKNIKVTECRIANFSELSEAIANNDFNVLLLLAHGDDAKGRVWLYNDVDQNGSELSVNVGQLATALMGSVDNKLCLFGVCHFGTKDLADAVREMASALVSIAPMHNYSISQDDIVNHYGDFLNAMQKYSYLDQNWEFLHSELKGNFGDLAQNLSIFPEQ